LNLRSLSLGSRIGLRELLGVFRASELIAVARFGIQDGPKTAHKGVLWGMYVRPEARRAGVGKRLVRAIIDLASERVEPVQLTVLADNHEARQLYSGLGFIENMELRRMP
jgi:ribosomal protein S18 acetylase RimI-like enzyme